MVEKGKGTIVNVGSVVGRIGMPFSGAYSASKFALEGMSETMRMELWPLGVRVAIVEPGLFRTSFLQNQVAAADSAALPPRRQGRRGAESAGSTGAAGWGGDPAKVARVIRKIIRSRRPAFRYVVGPDARMAVAAKWVLPRAPLPVAAELGDAQIAVVSRHVLSLGKLARSRRRTVL